MTIQHRQAHKWSRSRQSVPKPLAMTAFAKMFLDSRSTTNSILARLWTYAGFSQFKVKSLLLTLKTSTSQTTPSFLKDNFRQSSHKRLTKRCSQKTLWLGITSARINGSLEPVSQLVNSHLPLNSESNWWYCSRIYTKLKSTKKRLFTWLALSQTATCNLLLKRVKKRQT